MGGAIHDMELEKQVRIFPNPGTLPIIIKLDKVYATIRVQVSDMIGNVQQEFLFANTDFSSLNFEIREKEYTI